MDPRRVKYVVGEAVTVRCLHRQAGRLVTGWVAGRVVQVDARMAAIACAAEVFAANGWPIPDRILWCAHGSPNLRRPEPAGEAAP